MFGLDGLVLKDTGEIGGVFGGWWSGCWLCASLVRTWDGILTHTYADLPTTSSFWAPSYHPQNTTLVPPQTRGHLRGHISVYIPPGSPRLCFGREGDDDPNSWVQRHEAANTDMDIDTPDRQELAAAAVSGAPDLSSQRQDDSGTANISCSAPPRLRLVRVLCDGVRVWGCHVHV